MHRLIGASVLSAAGSLPLQILPFLVLSLVSSGRIQVAFAGWVGASFLIGMLSSALLLPAFKVPSLSRWHAFIAVCAIVAALIFSIESNQLFIFLMLWYMVGLACGSLQFLGATTAATAINKSQAFALRLAIALILASGVIIALAQFDSQKSYARLGFFLIGTFTLSAVIGLALYKSVQSTLNPNQLSHPNSIVSTKRSWSGLVIIFCFFVGQPGFWAYAMQSASQRGLDLKDAAMVIAASKIFSAFVLIYNSRKNSISNGFAGLVALGCAIAIGIFVMTYSSAVMLFFIGFLIWELALNVLSARIQGMVVAANPSHAGAWITGAIMLGAATGPVIHGAAIGGNIEWVFITYAAGVGLLPFLWAWYKRRSA